IFLGPTDKVRGCADALEHLAAWLLLLFQKFPDRENVDCVLAISRHSQMPAVWTYGQHGQLERARPDVPQQLFLHDLAIILVEQTQPELSLFLTFVLPFLQANSGNGVYLVCAPGHWSQCQRPEDGCPFALRPGISRSQVAVFCIPGAQPRSPAFVR